MPFQPEPSTARIRPIRHCEVILLALLVCPDLALAQPKVALEVAFPELRFTRPVDLQHEGQQLFVVEQAGRIWTFENDPTVTERHLFLDIRDRVRTSNNEEGLLGLAFHPDYATNGYFYVYYSASSPRRTVLARYSASAGNTLQADKDSESVLLAVQQPAGNHNGGQIAFGPDSLLYIAFGDGGGANDTFRNGQDRTSLLGTIARIDVNQSPYGIPADNPFAGSTVFREEIYAWGLRNPWRFSFDRATGILYAGDVGQNAIEEIDVITKGGNYGWNIMEGGRCFRPPIGCDQSGLIAPILEYNHPGMPASVTGGYVYRGPGVPDLVGWYLFADYVDGRLWGLVYDGNTVTHNALLLNSRLTISSFGIDHAGEVYLLAFDGFVYRLLATGGKLGFEAFAKDLSFVQGVTISDVVFPAARGGTTPYTYSIAPALPEGLAFDASTRTISGTPADSLAPVSFEYAATDASGRNGALSFTLEIKGSPRLTRDPPLDPLPSFVLHGNHPNPFTRQTQVTFDLATSATVSLEVLDLLGRRVSLHRRTFAAGEGHMIRIDGEDLPSGLYLCRVSVSTGSRQSVKSTTLLRIH